MKICIEEDIFGNIKKHIVEDDDFYEKSEYEYNDKGDLVSEFKFDKNDNLIQKSKFDNQYDKHGNITNTKNMCYMISQSELNYDNYYDNDKLIKVVCRYDPMEILSIQKFFYKDDILVKKELYKETPFESPTNISYFLYDSQGQVKEEKICLERVKSLIIYNILQ